MEHDEQPRFVPQQFLPRPILPQQFLNPQPFVAPNAPSLADQRPRSRCSWSVIKRRPRSREVLVSARYVEREMALPEMAVAVERKGGREAEREMLH
ncbi:hypothetical protein Dimus_021041, partial [Dionaea muscipula]